MSYLHLIITQFQNQYFMSKFFVRWSKRTAI